MAGTDSPPSFQGVIEDKYSPNSEPPNTTRHKECPLPRLEDSIDNGYVSCPEEEKREDCTRTQTSENSSPNCSFGYLDELCDLHSLPPDMKKILQGFHHPLPEDYEVPIDEKPIWYDECKFKLGQGFAQKYYSGLNYSEMLSLFILFSIPNGLQPLIFTGRSSTPYTAFKRYLSTTLRLKTWYEDDIWNKDSLGYKNLKAVRAMHVGLSKRLNSTPYEDLKSQFIIDKYWGGLIDQIQDDFQYSCPYRAVEATSLDQVTYKSIHISQLQMSFTQFGFFGLILLHPDMFGATNATEEELEGFIHLWRCLGYLLGIRDEFNFCNGSLDEVRKRCQCFIDSFAKPFLQQVTSEWEHMSRCMVEGVSFYMPGVTFEESLLYLCWVLDVHAPRLKAALSWGQCVKHHLSKLTMSALLSNGYLLSLMNWNIRRSIKKAASFTAEDLHKLETKKYEYDK